MKPNSQEIKQWNVSVEGRYVGSVFATTEELARLAALSTYDIGEDADFEVGQ